MLAAIPPCFVAGQQAAFPDFLSKPDDELFEQIYRENPALYFSSLVQLAKVLKVEVGEVGAFDNKPRPREEALRKLEERAGTTRAGCSKPFCARSTSWKPLRLRPRKARNDPKHNRRKVVTPRRGVAKRSGIHRRVRETAGGRLGSIARRGRRGDRPT
jgi:hypothetical protein